MTLKRRKTLKIKSSLKIQDGLETKKKRTPKANKPLEIRHYQNKDLLKNQEKPKN